MPPSPQLAAYLRLRAEGCGIATAAEESGLPVDEAWEAEAAVQRGELKFTRGEDPMPKHDQAEACGILDYELHCAGIVPPWRSGTPQFKLEATTR